MSESIQEVYSATSKFFAEIVNKKDEYVQKRIQDYAKEHAKQFGENVEVLFLDEDKVKQIIQLGIQQYLQREKKLGMTDKEKEAIEIVNQIRIDFFDSKYKKEHSEDELAEKYEALCSILNLIQTQKEEIQQVLDDYQDLGKEKYKLECELEKKDKMIDEMVQEYEYNARINVKNFCEEELRKDTCIQDCRACIKEYFINKVEKENKDDN